MEYAGRLLRLLSKFLFRFADRVILQTKQAQNFFPKAVQKKSRILPNPINPQFLNKRYLGVREDVIVAAGRLDENKNHAMLIHAFAKIAAEYPTTELIIYGEGELRSKLENLVEEKGLSDRISLPGRFPWMSLTAMILRPGEIRGRMMTGCSITSPPVRFCPVYYTAALLSRTSSPRFARGFSSGCPFFFLEFHHIGASAARDGHSCFLRMCMIHKVMY